MPRKHWSGAPRVLGSYTPEAAVVRIRYCGSHKTEVTIPIAFIAEAAHIESEVVIGAATHLWRRASEEDRERHRGLLGSEQDGLDEWEVLHRIQQPPAWDPT